MAGSKFHSVGGCPGCVDIVFCSLERDDIPAAGIEEKDLLEIGGEFRILKAHPPATVALQSRRRVATGLVILAPDENCLPVDNQILCVVVAVLCVARVGRRHHEDRNTAPVEAARDRPLLWRDPTHRSPFKEDGHGHAPFTGSNEVLRHGRVGKFVDVYQDLTLC